MRDVEAMVGPHTPGILEQGIDEDLIIFNPETDRYYTLNNSAREVWQLADGSHTRGEIISIMAARYDIATAVIAGDISAIIANFRDAGLVG